MKRIYISKISILVIMFFVIISLFSVTKAISITEWEDEASNFINKGKETFENSNVDFTNVVAEFADLGSILTMLGAGVLVGITTYMGIKYLTSGPEAQAKLKTQLVGVLVSGIVIFGAYYIWKIVINIASSF